MPENMYKGTRLPNGATCVHWLAADGSIGPLEKPAGWEAIRFDWGEYIVGGYALAFALLLDATADRKRAACWAAEFRREMLEPISEDTWTITLAEVFACLGKLESR